MDEPTRIKLRDAMIAAQRLYAVLALGGHGTLDDPVPGSPLAAALFPLLFVMPMHQPRRPGRN